MSYTLIGGAIPRGMAAFVALSTVLASAAPAVAQKPEQVCIDATEIDHTHALNARQVLFYMKDRKVWLNTLKAPCASLSLQEGFVLPTGFSTFCSNAQAITVLNTRQVCLLGEFTPYQTGVGHS
jgi:hypothetical protein